MATSTKPLFVHAQARLNHFPKSLKYLPSRLNAWVNKFRQTGRKIEVAVEGQRGVLDWRAATPEEIEYHKLAKLVYTEIDLQMAMQQHQANVRDLESQIKRAEEYLAESRALLAAEQKKSIKAISAFDNFVGKHPDVRYTLDSLGEMPKGVK